MTISITKPTVGGSENTWGTTVNAALDTIVDGINGTSGTIAPDLSTLTINGTDVTATATELNVLDGVTATTAELNVLDGVTATTAELNILDGVTATAAELNILDGVTATTAELNILDGVTATAAELNVLDGVTATAAELNHTDGVTSNIQTQLNRRLELISETVLSSNASDVTFTLPTGYRDFQLVFNYVKPSTGSTTLWLEFSTDSGTSWITTGYHSMSQYFTSTTEGSNSASSGIIVATNNEADDEFINSTGSCGVIDIFNPLNASTHTSAIIRATNTNYSIIHTPKVFINTGVYDTEVAVNAINLSHKTGASVASGAVVALYGMKDY